jgi:hypothetical protein
MNTTAPKKTRSYRVAISHHPSRLVVEVFVRAESMAQARNHVWSTMLTVSPATTDEILDLKREDVIDANAAPDQPQLPLPPTTGENETFGKDFIDGIADNATEG